MSEAFSSPRRRVNDISMYQDSPRQMVKSDDLKAVLEKLYVEKAEKIITEMNRLRNFIKVMGIWGLEWKPTHSWRVVYRDICDRSHMLRKAIQ